jgi:polyphosphate kinase
LDKALKRRVMAEGLNPYLKDNQNAWELERTATTSAARRAASKPFSAQQHLMETLAHLTPTWESEAWI